MLRNLLKQRADQIHGRWLDDVLAAYPAEARACWTRERNPFANPVGHALRQGTRALLDAVLDGSGDDALRAALGEIVRIRAVQGFSPAEALRFVFRLRELLRAEVRPVPPSQPRSGVDSSAPGAPPGEVGTWREIDAAIDRAALVAFDLWNENRERLSEIRIAELKKNIPWVVGRMEAAGRMEAR